MSINKSFPSGDVQLQTVCVALKRDEEKGIQIAVVKNQATGQNNTVLPTMAGNPRSEKYMESVCALLKGLGVKETKLTRLPGNGQKNIVCQAICGEVSEGRSPLDHYTFIPLTGAYDEVSYPLMKQAIVQICMDQEVPLTDRSISRRLQNI